MKSSSNHELHQLTETDGIHTVPVFGYELLRDILIPDLLGKDTREISYWAGKHLARKFPLLSIEESSAFFQEAGWGQLLLIDERKNELKLELSGHMVDRRFQMRADPCFSLEAGFIAQQIQTQKQVVAEAYDEIKNKQKKVTLIVRWDRKDPATDK